MKLFLFVEVLRKKTWFNFRNSIASPNTEYSTRYWLTDTTVQCSIQIPENGTWARQLHEQFSAIDFELQERYKRHKGATHICCSSSRSLSYCCHSAEAILKLFYKAWNQVTSEGRSRGQQIQIQKQCRCRPCRTFTRQKRHLDRSVLAIRFKQLPPANVQDRIASGDDGTRRAIEFDCSERSAQSSLPITSVQLFRSPRSFAVQASVWGVHSAQTRAANGRAATVRRTAATIRWVKIYWIYICIICCIKEIE